jgi:hypothetical protein
MILPIGVDGVWDPGDSPRRAAEGVRYLKGVCTTLSLSFCDVLSALCSDTKLVSNGLHPDD